MTPRRGARRTSRAPERATSSEACRDQQHQRDPDLSYREEGRERRSREERQAEEREQRRVWRDEVAGGTGEDAQPPKRAWQPDQPSPRIAEVGREPFHVDPPLARGLWKPTQPL